VTYVQAGELMRVGKMLVAEWWMSARRERVEAGRYGWRVVVVVRGGCGECRRVVLTGPIGLTALRAHLAAHHDDGHMGVLEGTPYLVVSCGAPGANASPLEGAPSARAGEAPLLTLSTDRLCPSCGRAVHLVGVLKAERAERWLDVLPEVGGTWFVDAATRWAVRVASCKEFYGYREHDCDSLPF
jgi:hypothetical protein